MVPMRTPFLAACVLLSASAVLATAALATEGPVGPDEGDPMQKIRELSVKISRALKENEDALTRLARGEKGVPKSVDITLPKHNHEGGT